MIVLRVPEGGAVRLDDADGRAVAALLWDWAADRGTASLAVAMQEQLALSERRRRPIDVPLRTAPFIAEAIGQIPPSLGDLAARPPA